MKTAELDTQAEAILGLMANWDAASPAERRRRQDRIEEHQRIISDAYGVNRGWRRASEQFSIRALASVSRVGEKWEPEFTDHHSFWMMDGRPVAVVAHLYSCNEKQRAAVRAWAARHGLQATFSTDFPSW
jgi:hypothetical protein